MSFRRSSSYVQVGFTNNRGRNCVLQSRGEDFYVVVGNVQNLQSNNHRKDSLMKQAFDLAKKNRVYVTIKPDGPHKDLMTHRHVTPQVIGTNSNVTSVENMEFPVDFEANPGGAYMSGGLGEVAGGELVNGTPFQRGMMLTKLGRLIRLLLAKIMDGNG